MVHLDDYSIGKCLQADGRCEMYAAVRQSDGRRVALKWYSDDRLSWARRELEVLTSLAGPGIVRALDLLDSREGPVLVLDPVDGGISLREWVEGDLPSEAEFIEVATHVSQALARIHAAHWMHRAVTPEHVLVPKQALARMN